MDVLRENIGLLQLPYEDEYLNEGFLGFGKKKSRWQRFKDMVKRNKGKIAAGTGLLGAGAVGGLIGKDYINYRQAKHDFLELLQDRGDYKKQKDGSYHAISSRYVNFPNDPVKVHDVFTPKFKIENPFKSNFLPGDFTNSTYYTYNGKRFDSYDDARRAAEKDGHPLI